MSNDSFTNGKPRIATAQDCNIRWAGGRDGKYFRCYLCGHKFKEGDQFRWVFTNNIPGAGGNPIVCASCDADNESVIAKWKSLQEEYKKAASGKFWCFVRNDCNAAWNDGNQSVIR